jgi:hypothetical protein
MPGPHLATFRQKHPCIVVDLLATNSILDHFSAALGSP